MSTLILQPRIGLAAATRCRITIHASARLPPQKLKVCGQGPVLCFTSDARAVGSNAANGRATILCVLLLMRMLSLRLISDAPTMERLATNGKWCPALVNALRGHANWARAFAKIAKKCFRVNNVGERILQWPLCSHRYPRPLSSENVTGAR